jgi:hypothetical protein
MLVLLAGCEPGPALYVDLRTDLVAGVEFHAVEIALDEGEPLLVPAERSRAEYLAGVRVAELTELELGPHRVDVRLVRGEQRVAERALLVRVEGAIVVTALITRSCRDVACPEDGGDPAATTCEGGRCVVPECTPETPDACPAAQCATAADCSAEQACSAARCEGGVCLVDDAGSCGAGEFCHPAIGCGPSGGGDCPPYMQAVESAEGPFCIDVYDSGDMTWVAAMAYCEGRGGSLCTPTQWMAACETSGESVDGLLGGWEWTRELVDADNALKHGSSACDTTSPHSTTDGAYQVRCCLPR